MRNLRGIALLVAVGCGGSTPAGSGGGAGGQGMGGLGGTAGGGGLAAPGGDYPPGAEHVRWFREVTADSGVTAAHHTSTFAVDMSFALRGTGLAVGDLDGDGKPDLVTPTGLGPTIVYRNLGGMRFADVSAASGVDAAFAATGASICDLDGDGALDLLLFSDEVVGMDRPQGNLRFYRNRGDGTFTDQTAAAGFAVRGGPKQALCADLDGDGLLDVHVADYMTDFQGSGRADQFYRNNGDGTFEELSERLGFDTIGDSWAAAAIDVDGDGLLDLYVGNDTFVTDDGTRPLPVPNLGLTLATDRLFRNLGPGADGYTTFAEQSTAAGVAEPRGTMNILYDDFDADGRPDLYLSNFGRNPLLAGHGDGTFTDHAVGLEATSRSDALCPPAAGGVPAGPECLLVSWGAAFQDFDLDGWRDLIVLNEQLRYVEGRQISREQPTVAWRGAEGGRLVPVQTELGWMPGRALVATDLDGDGALDLAITTWGGPVRLYQNVATEGRSPSWLGVRLEAHASASEGRGAEVSVVTGGRTLVTRIGTGGIAYSSAPAEAHFGLASAEPAVVTVQWPSGYRQTMESVAPGQVLTIREPELVRLSSRVVPADGRATVEVTVHPATAAGDGAVTIESSAGSWQGALVDAGDGSYHRTLVAPSAPALAVLRITIAGSPLRVYPRVRFR